MDRPLRVALINTFDVQGGAARAMWRLHKGLRMIDIESTVLCLHKRSNDPYCDQMNGPASEEATQQLQAWEADQQYVRSNLVPPYPYFTLPVPGYDLAQHPVVQNADIIHLHWVAGLASPDSIQSLQMLGKPIVWTLHDQRPFTGGCHYSNGCSRYETDCKDCPVLQPTCNHISSSILEYSLAKYDPSKITVVSPSSWLASCVGRSKVLGMSRVETIPYGLDTKTFRPIPKLIAHHKLGLATGPLNLLIGSDNLKDPRKGITTIISALQFLIKDENCSVFFKEGKVRVLTFGRSGEMFHQFQWAKDLGVITNEEKLSHVYSAGDVFICATNEDNLPSTILEAMSCQTPVVGTKVGGIPDMVTDQENGWLIETGDAAGLASLLSRIIINRNLLSGKGELARSAVVNNFNLDLQAKRYEDLYQTLLRNQVLTPQK